MTVGTARRPGSRRDASSERRDSYRQLRIVAGAHGEGYKAIAWRGGRKFIECDAVDLETAVAQLKLRIDSLHAERSGRRRGGEPTVEEYGDALARIQAVITPVQQAAIARHAAAPGGCVTFERLAAGLGVGDDAILKAYVRLGRLIGDVLDFQPEPQMGLGKSVQPILVVAQPAEAPGGDIRWFLRDNLRQAVEAGRG